jgi:hypothetical protein
MASQRAPDASEPIVYIDHSDVREGALEELKAGVHRLVDFIEAREPELILYGFYIDEDAMKMTVVAVHPDPTSLELHMDIGGAEFRKLAHLLTLTGIECYGRPSGKALEQLRQKAAMLGDGGTIISVDRSAGFLHLAAANLEPMTGNQAPKAADRSITEGGRPMTAWTTDELDEIEAADELELASLRPDGGLRNPTTIWVVRLGDDLYVRSVNGRASGWFRATQVRHEGRIRAGGVEKNVIFVDGGGDVADRIDDAYRTKYRRYSDGVVGTTITPEARAATLNLVPRS